MALTAADAVAHLRAGQVLVEGMPPPTASETSVASARHRGLMSRGPANSRAEDLVVSHNLTKRYGERIVVDDLSFTVRPGVVTGFLGPNGAGKSTPMRMLVGLDRPTQGDITIDGRGYQDLPDPVAASRRDARASRVDKPVRFRSASSSRYCNRSSGSSPEGAGDRTPPFATPVTVPRMVRASRGAGSTGPQGYADVGECPRGAHIRARSSTREEVLRRLIPIEGVVAA